MSGGVVGADEERRRADAGLGRVVEAHVAAGRARRAAAGWATISSSSLLSAPVGDAPRRLAEDARRLGDDAGDAGARDRRGDDHRRVGAGTPAPRAWSAIFSSMSRAPDQVLLVEHDQRAAARSPRSRRPGARPRRWRPRARRPPARRRRSDRSGRAPSRPPRARCACRSSAGAACRRCRPARTRARRTRTACRSDRAWSRARRAPARAPRRAGS